MKFIVPVLFIASFSFGVFAQNQPQSILNQLPYVPELSEKASVSRLNTQEMMNGLEPLPDFQIPQGLPQEFMVSSDARRFFELSREANRFLMEGRPEKSVELFKEALEEWPDEWGIRVALADSLYAMGDHPGAVVEYRKVLEQIPLHFQCLNNLAWLYATTSQAELKNLQAAEDLAEKAKLVQPRSHHLWSTLSQIYFEKGDYAMAQNSINNALTLAQQSQVNLNVVVSYLVQRDRCNLALQATSLLE